MLRKALFLIFCVVASCGKDRAELRITDFEKQESITLEPYKLIPYSMFNLHITGYSNDTIRIKTKGIYNLDLRLTGDIDTLWYSDYYGEGPIECTFLPYKATKGNLEIKINL
ncbi:hypothetical protein [Maribacter polysiphoniae]|uniref:hypothetical protein n=1 Tax=Maribacter polysiphoniae TaxID=429344 RepID=UPI002352C8A6|nr:hypothetical protein [Maribacter polysiphoniae]